MKSGILGGLIMQGGFALFALGAYGAVDYAVQARSHGPGYSVGAWLGDVSDRVRIVVNRPRAPRLDELVPAPPQGWQVAAFEEADIALVTGAPPAGKEKVSVGQVLMGAGMMQGVDTTAVYRTYRSGDRAVLFKFTRIDNGTMNGLAGEAIERMMAFAAAMDEPGAFFAAKDGLWFYERESERYPGVREIQARLGKQLQVVLLTRDARNDGLIGILAGLDVAALNAMAVEPVPGIGTGGLGTMPPPGGDPQAAWRAEVIGAAVAGDVGPPPAAAPDAAPAAEAGGGGGSGLSGLLGGLFGGRKGEAGGESASGPSRTITCRIEQGAKRCSVEND